jgi:hypothetical protein
MQPKKKKKRNPKNETAKKTGPNLNYILFYLWVALEILS